MFYGFQLDVLQRVADRQVKAFCINERTASRFGNKLPKIELHFVGRDVHHIFLLKRLDHVAIDAGHVQQGIARYQPSGIGVGEGGYTALRDAPRSQFGTQLKAVFHASIRFMESDVRYLIFCWHRQEYVFHQGAFFRIQGEGQLVSHHQLEQSVELFVDIFEYRWLSLPIGYQVSEGRGLTAFRRLKSSLDYFRLKGFEQGEKRRQRFCQRNIVRRYGVSGSFLNNMGGDSGRFYRNDVRIGQKKIVGKRIQVENN